MQPNTWFHSGYDVSIQSVTVPSTCPDAKKVFAGTINRYVVHIHETTFNPEQDDEIVQWEGGQFGVVALVQVFQYLCSCEGECVYVAEH